MTPSMRAELVGPQGELRHRVADALLGAGWDVPSTDAAHGPLDLGVFIPAEVPAAPLATTSASEWWSYAGGDLTSAFRCAKALTPRLSASGGALVFVSSLLGDIGAPNQTAFSAAAAGIIGLVKALTLDVPTVRFSAVAPAWPVPAERWYSADVDWRTASPSREASGTVRATADAVLFLANDKEGHLRGQVIRIPSGITT